MRRLVLGSFSLMFFAFSVLFFQVSCEKETIASDQDRIENAQQNRIAYIFYPSNSKPHEIWTASYDGTNNKKLDINLPEGSSISSRNLSVSPDGRNIFFTVDDLNNKRHIYKCSIDGTNVTLVIDESDSKDGYQIKAVVAF